MHHDIGGILAGDGAEKSREQNRLLPASSLHVQLQQVADATLTLFVDEIFTVGEVAVAVLRLIFGLALRNSDLLAIQCDEGVLGWIW